MSKWACLALLASLPLLAQSLRFSAIPGQTMLERLRRLPAGDNTARHQALRTLMDEAGCSGARLEDQKARGSRLPNVVCTLPGPEGARMILVTAHYDKVRAGAGAIDNWSGASLLPTLYDSLSRNEDRKHTFLFIGFTDEEAGLIGSKSWESEHRKAYAGQIAAVVNIDSVAAGPLPLYVWRTRSAPELVGPAYTLSRALGIAVTEMNADKVGDSDSTPFRNRKIPTIDFHSLNNRTFPLLHTIDDQLSRVDTEAYQAIGRYLSAYLAFIDGKLDAPR